jgi:RNA polymerase sigma-70 factor (ECF subfamily)
VRRTLDRIWADHGQGLYTLALAIVRCPAGAEDAVQDALARLWRRRGPPSGDAVAYTFAAVRNAALAQRRRRRRESAGAPVSIFNGRAPDPLDDAIGAERDRRIRDGVESLPEAEREAVVLRVYAGLTFEQMAEVLGEPLGTVASRYRRAIERLKGRIGADL